MKQEREKEKGRDRERERLCVWGIGRKEVPIDDLCEGLEIIDHTGTTTRFDAIDKVVVNATEFSEKTIILADGFGVWIEQKHLLRADDSNGDLKDPLHDVRGTFEGTSDKRKKSSSRLHLDNIAGGDLKDGDGVRLGEADGRSDFMDGGRRKFLTVGHKLEFVEKTLELRSSVEFDVLILDLEIKRKVWPFPCSAFGSFLLQSLTKDIGISEYRSFEHLFRDAHKVLDVLQGRLFERLDGVALEMFFDRSNLLCRLQHIFNAFPRFSVSVNAIHEEEGKRGDLGANVVECLGRWFETLVILFGEKTLKEALGPVKSDLVDESFATFQPLRSVVCPFVCLIDRCARKTNLFSSKRTEWS